MDGRRRRDTSSLPESANLTATHGHDNELNLLDSVSHSSLTIENSEGKFFQIEDLAKDCLMAWTDEKHDLYLDHLESSFVEQLHQSIGILAWCSGDDSKSPYLSRESHAKTQEKIDLQRNQPVMDHATDSLVVLKSRNRCTDNQRFVTAAKLHISSAARNLCTDGVKAFLNEPGRHSKQISSRLGKSIDCIGEFSDQNFVDEGSEQMCVAKRSKTIVSEV